MIYRHNLSINIHANDISQLQAVVQSLASQLRVDGLRSVNQSHRDHALYCDLTSRDEETYLAGVVDEARNALSWVQRTCEREKEAGQVTEHSLLERDKAQKKLDEAVERLQAYRAGAA